METMTTTQATKYRIRHQHTCLHSAAALGLPCEYCDSPYRDNRTHYVAGTGPLAFTANPAEAAIYDSALRAGAVIAIYDGWALYAEPLNPAEVAA